MKVKCIFDRSPSSTNGFSNGRTYDVIKREGNGHVVLNDNGHERFILLDTPSPHIRTPDREFLGGNNPAGHFEEVAS